MAAASKGIAQRVTEAFTRLTVAALSRSRLLRALVGDRLGDRLWLRDLVRRAGAPDRATRLTALQHIWDYLDFVAWTDEAVAPVVAALVALAPGETDDEVLEQLLADLMKAFHGPKWKGRAPDFAAVSFDPIAELIVPGFRSRSSATGC